MSTPRFNANLLEIAQRLHDKRTDPTSGGDGSARFTSALLSQYQNTAIRDTIKDVYLKFSDRIVEVMPEIVLESGNITLTSGVGTVDADTWVVLEVAKSDYTWYAYKIRQDILRVKAGRDGMIVPSLTKPAFYQSLNTIIVLPTTITGPAHTFYIQAPADVVVNGATDIKIAPIWDGEIIERAIAFGTADAKASIAS